MSTPRPLGHPQAAAAGLRLVGGTDGVFRAEGALTFATARAARTLSSQLFAGATPALTVDCAGITSSDSAGLAVLLDWLASAKGAHRALHYTNLPTDLAALARISEVEELLTRGV
jgi:phospholipid transport system transporter-binding protein